MAFEVIIESRNAHYYYSVVNFLFEHDIEFDRLHEYRLDPAKNHNTIEPAFIRVPENKVQLVKELLVKHGYIEGDNSGDTSSSNSQGRSSRNEELYKSELFALKGEKIVNVTYVLCNYANFEFNQFHSVDQSILIELTNNKWLFWNFEEVFLDEGRYLPDRYDLTFPSERPNLETDFYIKDASEHPQWKKLIGTNVTDISLFTIDFQFSPEMREEKIVTDVVIQTDAGVVGFYFTDEPDPSILGTNECPSFENITNWSMVAFGEEEVKRIDGIRVRSC